MASKNLDVGNVEKKFRGVSQTQENIQSLTLWVIHHKAQHEKIVELWFQVFKKSKMPHRLTLLYLCNDIVQTCKRKHAVVYKDAFKEVLKDAILLVRDSPMRSNISRIFTIWEERGIYDSAFLEELASILNNTKVTATENSKLLADFKPQELTGLILRVKKHEDEVTIRSRQLTNLRLDPSTMETVKQLKDRSRGKEYCQQFEDSCGRLETFVEDLEKGIKDQITLVELLEQSELFYDTQYGEAKIVANAYKNFGTRVNNLRRRLEEHIKMIPEPYSPVPSPTSDAPSPGNTPPQARGTLDMVFEEDEKVVPIPGLETIPDPPTVTTSHPLLPPGFGDFFSQLVGGGDNKPAIWSPPPPPSATSADGGSNLVQLTDGSGTPVNDEGSSTPVQDEQPEVTEAPVEPTSSNPIEFLQQLLSNSQKAPSSANLSFFQNLSVLTEQVKKSREKEEELMSGGDPTTPGTEEYLPPATWEEPWQAEAATPTTFSDAPPLPPSDSNTVPYSSESGMYTAPPPPQPYTMDSASYNTEVKPEEAFPPIPPEPPMSMLYGIDPNNPPPPPQMEPSTPYNPESPYIPPDQPVGGAPMLPFIPPVPPPPPVNTSDNSLPPPPQSHYPPPFYQDAPPPPTPEGVPSLLSTPGTPPVSMTDGVPFPPPPAGAWQPDMFNAPPPFTPTPLMEGNNAPVMPPPPPDSGPPPLPFIAHNEPNLDYHPPDDAGTTPLRRNLATIQLTDSSPVYDTEPGVSSIHTVVGKRPGYRPQHPPRPPTLPPTPQTPGTPSSGRLRISDDDNRQDFIDKLKRKSLMPSTPPAPPKSILKNSSIPVMQTPRNLTAIPSEDKSDEDKGQVVAADDISGANEDMDLDESQDQEDDQPWPWKSQDTPPHPPHPQRGGHGPGRIDTIRPLLGSPQFRNRRPEAPRPPFHRDPRFSPHRMPPPYEPYRDSVGRPFPKRQPAPFEFNRRRFPRY